MGGCVRTGGCYGCGRKQSHNQGEVPPPRGHVPPSPDEEASQRALVELLRRLSSGTIGKRPFYIRSVAVEGNDATRLDVIEAELKAALEAGTLEEVLNELVEAQARLACMDLFKSIDVHCDEAKGDHGRAQATDVTIVVEERNRLTAKTGTTVDVNDGNVMAAVYLRNLFGAGERLEVDWSTGTKVTSFFKAAYTKPNLANYGEEWQVAAFKDNTDFQAVSSFNVKTKGVTLTYTIPTAYFDHIVGYAGVWREVCKLPDNASFSIRSMAGHSVKSAITHAAVMERRDDPVLPRSGYALKISQELAGLGGSAAFLKHEAKASASVTVAGRWTLTGLVAGGLVVPLMADGLSTVDAFHLGGSMDVRGFQTFGIGPHAPRKLLSRAAPVAAADAHHSDAVGGDAYWKACLHLYHRLHDTWGIYGQAFVNAGNLLLAAQSPRRFASRDLVSQARVAVGAGLAFRTAIGLVELNYTVPLRTMPGDRVQHGFQFGIALNYF
ncbi:outer membrane protein [Thecamonas trahens ATCC 50062]|uniref:Outer membrane protein n=1 Tax=Thecamonas trahens ATCC 50062 TaxID=461836 RepID=A0A0L0DHK3_THETB|nr:outer membrane protein [Thecamonas trahens ATCC 50062]KNC51700.1 outer membrane protein [Thecamonas trahens ATCC 50062]|eukprot:XP_013755829.1 outer membrane protein [Thecamonas trahens ATCC 50062]